MSGNTKTFIISDIVVVSLLTVIAEILFRHYWPEMYPPLLFLIPLFFWVMLAVMLILRKKLADKGKPFQFFAMVYRPVKFLLMIVFLLAVILAAREYAIPFVITFLVYYLVLLVHEMIFMVRFAKEKQS